MAKVLCGKTLALNIQRGIAERVAQLKDKVVPGLAVVQVGSVAASTAYIRMKRKAATEVGMNFSLCALDEKISTEGLLKELERLNGDPSVHGLIVQLPLPKHIEEQLVIDSVAHSKDVDGFHILNVGALGRGQQPLFIPCTPRGVMAMIDSVPGFQLAGSKAVVVGRSNIVGRPVAQLLLSGSATVEITHSRTRGLADEIRTADLLVAAVGKPHFVQPEWVKPGAVVIDVGTNAISDPASKSGSRLVGDCHPDVAQVAGHMSPVPGGVGPMTVAMLLLNTLEAAERSIGIRLQD